MKGHHTVSSWRKSVISKIYERYEKKQKIWDLDKDVELLRNYRYLTFEENKINASNLCSINYASLLYDSVFIGCILIVMEPQFPV
jgi:hypothetical protein